MRCEVVAVGTELLLGQIVDSNSAWIGEQLALAGIDSHFQTKVGDNLGRIVATIRLALSRAEAVILCGGLGPTQDDITREAIAEVLGVELVRNAGMAERIRALFAARKRPMTENNMRQADLPEGASFIPEMPGTAPGLICPHTDKVIYAVPGVPFEMRAMVGATVIPDLQRRAGVRAVIRSRVLRSWGQTESGLAEMLSGRIAELDELGTATLAFQASGIEGLKVRITAKAADEAAAQAVLADEEARIRAILGDVIFGVDGETMEHAVLKMLKAQGLSLAVAEQLTAGLVALRLSSAADGADGTFLGGVVCGFDGSAHGLLGAPPGPPVSPETATAMAERVRALLAADVGIAACGVAGPEAQDGHRPGTAFLGLALGNRAESAEVRLPGDRERIRQYAVISLLNFLRRNLGADAPDHFIARESRDR